MYDAQTITCADTTATNVYSPWFPRGGDYGLFTLEVSSMSSSSSTLSLTVQMIHKNSAEAGDGGSVGSSFSRTGSNYGATPRTTGTITAGFKELVRYKFTLALSSGSGQNWAIFRMLPPIWYDAVAS
jgi:hypothetical protein